MVAGRLTLGGRGRQVAPAVPAYARLRLDRLRAEGTRACGAGSLRRLGCPRPVLGGLMLLDELLYPNGVAFAVAVAADRLRAAARLDDAVRKDEIGVDLHGSHVRDVDR